MSRLRQFLDKNNAFVFVLCSSLIVLAGVFLLKRMYPIHLNSNIAFGQDPAYQYLFAGVDILRGHAPFHTDHPGTPLQSLIATTIAVVWALLKIVGFETAGIFDSVLLHPERYLIAISCVLLSLSALAIYYAGLRVYRSTHSYALAISCQFCPLLFQAVVPNLVFPAPEALLITIVIALLGVIAPIVLSKPQPSENEYLQASLPSGLLCGLGVATKITFFPLLGMLLLLKYPRIILRGFAFALLGWIIGVAPIFERLPSMFAWFFQVLTHAGVHGEGTQGVFDTDQFQMTVFWLIRHFKLLYYVGLCLVCILLIGIGINIVGARRRSATKGDFVYGQSIDSRVPAIFLAVMLAQTVMVAKHPGLTYMIPVLPLTVLGGVWVINNLDSIKVLRSLKDRIAPLWLAGIAVLSISSFNEAYSTVAANQTKGQLAYVEINNEIKKYENPTLIGAFNCNFEECAEWFGMLLVPEMELRMTPVTPNFWHYDVFNKRLHVPGVGELTDEQLRKVVSDLIAENRPILLISPEFDQLGKFELERIQTTSVQNLYRVRGVANK